MKAPYDPEAHRPPDIPETLKEEYRSWDLGQQATFPKEKGLQEETVKRSGGRFSAFKNMIFLPVATVAAAAVLFTTAASDLPERPEDPSSLPPVLSQSETRTSSQPGDHTHAWVWEHALFEGKEVHRQVCTVCGESSEYEEHEWREFSDESFHWWQCTVCSYISGDEKLPHSGGTATCAHAAICDACGREYGAPDPENHEGPTEIRGAAEATETENGYTGDEYCLACSQLVKKGSVIPSKDHVHVLSFVEEKAPDHYAEGNVSYYRCSDCGLLFLDAAAETQTDEESVLLPVIPHEYKQNFDETGHWMECECGSVLTKEAHEFRLEPVSGQDAHVSVCTVCGRQTEPEAHVWELYTDASFHWWQCTVCEHVSGDEKLPHSGGTASCTHRAQCDVCGLEYGQTDPENHDGPLQTRGAYAATESKEGYTGDVYCSACSLLVQRGATIPKLSHRHTLTRTAAKDATHYETGNTEYWYCASCGSYFSDSQAKNQITQSETVIPVIPHSLAYKYDVYGHWQECACGYKTESESHAYGAWTTTKEPTCTETGSRQRRCSVCARYTSGAIAALGHDYDTTTAICTRCSDVLVTVRNTLSTTEEKFTPSALAIAKELEHDGQLFLSATFQSGVTATDISWTVKSDSAAAATLTIKDSGTDCSVVAASAGYGTVTFSFRALGKTFALPFRFRVLQPPPSIYLPAASVSIYAGDTQSLGAVLQNPANSGSKLSYSSSNSGIVTVSSSGEITGVSAGSATITVRCAAENVSATVRVTVTTPEWDLTAPTLGDSGPGLDEYALYRGSLRIDESGKQRTIYGDDFGTWVEPVSTGGFSYDPSTNTLTIQNVNSAYLQVTNMGGDFKIRVVGTNRLGTLQVEGGGRSSGIRFTGTGTLVVNEDKSSGDGINLSDSIFNGDKHEACVIIEGDVTLKAYGGTYAGAAISGSAIVVYNTSLSKGIYYLKAEHLEGGTRRFIDDNGNYTVVDSSGVASTYVCISPST